MAHWGPGLSLINEFRTMLPKTLPLPGYPICTQADSTNERNPITRKAIRLNQTNLNQFLPFLHAVIYKILTRPCICCLWPQMFLWADKSSSCVGKEGCRIARPAIVPYLNVSHSIFHQNNRVKRSVSSLLAKLSYMHFSIPNLCLKFIFSESI